MDDITQLIRRVTDGDANAFDAIVRHYQNPAVAYAYAVLGSRVRAEDAAQDAFLQAWRDLPTLRDAAAFGAWFRRIVFKHADRYRRQSAATASPESIAEAADLSADPVREVIREETRAATRDIVGSLGDGERAAITLFYMAGYSAAEVAAFLGLTETTVKQRLSRARKRLAERMAILVSTELQDMAPSKGTRFVEVARLQRQVTHVLEADDNVLAAYLAPFGKDEGFGAGNDAWASLNVHAVMKEEAMSTLAAGRDGYVRRVGGTSGGDSAYGEPILWVEGQQNAPPQGYYLMAIYDAPAGPYEVDWYWHAAGGASIPAEGRCCLTGRMCPSSPRR